MGSKVVVKDIGERVEQLRSELPWWKKSYYVVYRFFDRFSMIPSEIKWFIQRGRRGYSDSDTWSFDYYLATVIHKGVKRIREKRTGYPANMSEKEWDVVLGKISDGFGKRLDFYDNPDLWGDEKLKAGIEEAKQLFIEHFDSLWD